MIKQLVFMTEEASMEKFIEIILKKLLPENLDSIIISHEGKQDLEKSIPRKLRAWRNNDQVNYHFIIIRDKDSGNCMDIKNDLKNICKKAGRKDSIIIIAIHELESWFLGDLQAIEKAYNIPDLGNKQKNRIYRTPDKLANASEQLSKICKDRSKVTRTKKIAINMDFKNNLSTSFNHFIKKVVELSEK